MRVISQAWKDLERKYAKKLGVKRTAQPGRNVPDLEDHPILCPEIKWRSRLPKFLTKDLRQAKVYRPHKLPMVVYKERGKKGEIVCMYSSDFFKLYDMKTIDSYGEEE